MFGIITAIMIINYIYCLMYILLRINLENIEPYNENYSQKNYTLYAPHSNDLYLLKNNNMHNTNSPIYGNFINNTRKYI